VVEGINGTDWADPLAVAGDHPLYTTYSLMLATFLGTMGLPHVVVRYYTNPDGRAARKTTLVVLALLGAFYVLPPVYGALGRIYAPDLVGSGSDSVVLELPQRMIGGTGGDLLTALLTAGAFAAFLATSSGLTIAVAGVVSQDVTSKRMEGVAAFRLAAVVAVTVPLLVSLIARDVAVATVVGLAFAMAAATFAPLLVLGIWWRGLTAAGAVAGMVVGGSLTGYAVVDNLVADRTQGWFAALVEQPAAWAVPISIAAMVVVSRLTKAPHPTHVNRFLVRLHTPEAVELERS
jgi:cation/acetate symporter